MFLKSSILILVLCVHAGLSEDAAAPAAGDAAATTTTSTEAPTKEDTPAKKPRGDVQINYGNTSIRGDKGSSGSASKYIPNVTEITTIRIDVTPAAKLRSINLEDQDHSRLATSGTRSIYYKKNDNKMGIFDATEHLIQLIVVYNLVKLFNYDIRLFCSGNNL